MWVWVDAAQPDATRTKYLLDARFEDASGYFSSVNMGAGFESLLVNTGNVSVAWDNLLLDQWMHVVLVFRQAVDKDMVVMAKVGSTGQSPKHT